MRTKINGVFNSSIIIFFEQLDKSMIENLYIINFYENPTDLIRSIILLLLKTFNTLTKMCESCEKDILSSYIFYLDYPACCCMVFCEGIVTTLS